MRAYSLRQVFDESTLGSTIYNEANELLRVLSTCVGARALPLTAHPPMARQPTRPST